MKNEKVNIYDLQIKTLFSVANRALLAALALALFCVRPLPSLAYSSCVIAAMGALIWHGVRIAPKGMFGENSLRSA